METLAAIRARRKEIAEALEALTAEDQQLATTEAVLGRFWSAKRRQPRTSSSANQNLPAPPRARAGQSTSSARRAPRERTQRDYVLEALDRSPRAWMRTGEIIAFVEATWDQIIPELSLRPLLTKLKHEGAIVRSGRLIALKGRSAESKPARFGKAER